jgi:hypothetical protein
MTDDKTKTHWLQTPNKNYLGHWDLPNGKDIIVTISSAGWEEVKNPVINTSEAKRVIRFVEPNIKPFICNEGNSQSIIRSTGQKFMEDSVGFKIKLYVSQVKVKGQTVDCLRVREVSQNDLIIKVISDAERELLIELIEKAGKDTEETCEIMKIDSLANFPLHKYTKMCERLIEIAIENGSH